MLLYYYAGNKQSDQAKKIAMDTPDEPNAGLDKDTKTRLIDVLSSLDLSYILLSHENNFLYELTNSIYTMENGKIIPDKKHIDIIILISCTD